MDLLLFFKVHALEYLVLLFCSITIPLLAPSIFHTKFFFKKKDTSMSLYINNFLLIFLGGGITITFLIFILSFVRIFTSGGTILFIVTTICLWAVINSRK